MAPWTRYQLLDDSDEQTNIATSKRWLLESLQAAESISRAVSDRLQPLSDRFKQHPALWTTTVIAGAALLLVAIVVPVEVLASPSRSHGESASEDVLQYVDPLAGTGLGGAFNNSRGISLSFDANVLVRRACLCWSDPAIR